MTDAILNPPRSGLIRWLPWIAAALLALAAVGAAVWRYWPRPAPVFSEYPMLVPTDIPTAIAPAGNGAVWFTIEFSDSIGLLRNGKIERFTKGTKNLEPIGLAAAADGSAWFTDGPALAIKHINQSGELSTYPLDALITKFARLAVAPDGAVWFAESTAYSITRFKEGTFTRHTISSPQGGPYGVAIAADGTVWATLQSTNALMRIAPDGSSSEIDIPTRASQPTDIAVDWSGAVWFLEFRSNKIGRYADGQFAEYKVPGDGKAALSGLTVAPNGAVWFGMLRNHSLGRWYEGEFTVFSLPRPDARPYSVAADDKGAIWYTDISGWIGVLPVSEAVR